MGVEMTAQEPQALSAQTDGRVQAAVGAVAALNTNARAQWKTGQMFSHLTRHHFLNGRNGGIRTHDPLHPMQVRYQAALRPD